MSNKISEHRDTDEPIRINITKFSHNIEAILISLVLLTKC